MANRFRKLRYKLILMALSTTVVLLVCEFGFRVVLRTRYAIQVSSWESPLFKIEPDSEVEFTMHPGAVRESKVAEDLDVTWCYELNADGFRGSCAAGIKEADEIRILFLGDSYTFGWAVNDDETYPVMVEALLNERKRNCRFTSMNLAVPGYNTIQQSCLIHRVRDYRPDLVVLGYVMNDAEPQRGVVTDPDKAYKNATFWLLEYMKRQVSHSLYSDRPPFTVNIIYYNDWYLDGFETGSPKWKGSKAALGEIKRFCIGRKIPLLVLIFPDFNRPFDASYPFRVIHDSVSAWCAEMEIEAIDLLECFQGLDHQEYSVELDGHPNADAFKKIAEEIVNPIERILFGETR